MPTLLKMPEPPIVDDDDAAESIEEEFYPVEYSITSYGADFDVEGLVRRLNSHAIEVPTFQRGYVWRIYDASRFIESLLLGLPVPAVFLAREADQKLLVIDGQQRLRSLQFFYDGLFKPSEDADGEPFVLKRVHQHYEGKSYKTLDDRDRRKLDDSLIHAIIVKQEGPQESAPTSVFHIFERLNTGGMRLKAQEIRSAVYHGPFSDMLAGLNKDQNWRALFGPVSKNMRDQELILRFLALFAESDQYERPMKEFLNKFMFRNKNLNHAERAKLEGWFRATVAAINEGIGADAFRPSRTLNAAVCDSLMVAVARRLELGSIDRPDLLKIRYDKLLQKEGFLSAITTSTTNEENVSERLKQASNAIGQVK